MDGCILFQEKDKRRGDNNRDEPDAGEAFITDGTNKREKRCEGLPCTYVVHTYTSPDGGETSKRDYSTTSTTTTIGR